MNPYGVDTSESSIQGPIVSLNILYNEMPKTNGCDKCVDVNGENSVWCCKTMNPSMYYIEFLNAWKEVQKWNREKRADLIIRSIKNHLLGDVDKGCVFWSSGCTVYNHRPFSCRMYGVVPESSWDKRVSVLKKRFGEEYKIKPQCNLVSVVGDKKITENQEDEWFRHVLKCEERIGVPRNIINSHDNPQGSYRTFHDHILIELFDESFLTKISCLRLSNPSEKDINGFCEVLRKQLVDSGLI